MTTADKLREKAKELRLTMPISRTEPSTWSTHADALDLLADAYEALRDWERTSGPDELTQSLIQRIDLYAEGRTA